MNEYEKAVVEAAVEYVHFGSGFNPLGYDGLHKIVHDYLATFKLAEVAECCGVPVCDVCGKCQTICKCPVSQKKVAEIDHLNHNDTLPMVINMVNHLIEVVKMVN